MCCLSVASLLWAALTLPLVASQSAQLTPADFGQEIQLASYGASIPANESRAAEFATAFAFIYARPVGPFASVYQGLPTGTGVNKFAHQTNFTLRFAGQGAVLAPSAFAFLSVAVLDFSSLGQLMLDVPAVPHGRYYSVAIYDVYGNNIGLLSSVDGSKPGKYLLSYSSKHQATADASYDTKRFVGRHELNTAYGFILVSITVNNSDARDVRAVRQLQQKLTVTPESGRRVNRGIPTVDSLFSAQKFSNPQQNHPVEILNLLATVDRFSRPTNVSDVPRIRKLLSQAGIANGKFNSSYIDDLVETYYFAGNATVVHFLQETALLNNGWSALPSSVTGTYGIQYAIRAITSVFGYAHPRATVELTPAWAPQGPALLSAFSLPPGQALSLTFSGKPPLRQGGYWSLTAYNEDDFLYPGLFDSPQHVYSLGSRSGLVYSNGGKVYGSGSKNGPFELLVQPWDQPPPSIWTANWLPVPPNSANFTLDLHWFGPSGALSDGSYAYPVVKYIDVIAAGAS